MQDLTAMYDKAKSTLYFNNFFKSTSYKLAVEELEKKGVPKSDIIQKSPPAPHRRSQVLAHDLIALLFTQWLDEPRFCRMLLKLLEKP